MTRHNAIILFLLVVLIVNFLFTWRAQADRDAARQALEDYYRVGYTLSTYLHDYERYKAAIEKLEKCGWKANGQPPPVATPDRRAFKCIGWE